MIVTIDGPAGAGKSSAARALAKRLGFHFLDTGAMYRAVTLAAVRSHVDLAQPGALAAIARGARIVLEDTRVLLDDEDVSEAIRHPGLTGLIRYAADDPEVRAVLVELQRQAARGGNFVTEGRDQGTVVFPQAECKFFLTASPEVRARRRLAELLRRGADTTFDEVLSAQTERDAQDATRPVGRLYPAEDAIRVDTDQLGPAAVAEILERLFLERTAGLKPQRRGEGA
jgi:cytidylate kinase/pantoate ligase/cytidylate kinase